MRSILKNIFIAILAFVLLVTLFSSLGGFGEKREVIPLSETAQKIKLGEVERLVIEGETIQVHLANEQILESRKEADSSLTESLKNLGVSAEELTGLAIEVKTEKSFGLLLLNLLPIILPFLLVVVFFWFLFRQARAGQMQAFTFGLSGARLFDAKKEKVTFKNVAGAEEAKEELKEVVEFLRSPGKFLAIGARIPRGVLLMGAPGTGKTLLARAAAGEANVPFFFISGSEFVEMFVGVGASVTGDTPVLIRDGKEVRLLSISEFVDRYYQDSEADVVKTVSDIKTLSFEPLRTGFRGGRGAKKFFGASQWTGVKGVYRHKADKIYEVQYRGGSIRMTGDHSIFVREGNMIKTKKAEELKAGDILVNLPFKVRSRFVPGLGTTHKVSAHGFEKNVELELELYNEELERQLQNYNFVLSNRAVMSQAAIAETINVSQSTVKNWQLGYHQPQFLNANVVTSQTPSKIKVTSDLMRLLGYYTAEGRTTDYYTQFVFGLQEKDLQRDCIELLRNTFKLEPVTKAVPESNSFRINVSSPIIARFFEQHCGNGSHNKHLPAFIWDLPADYFLAYLKGYSRGDGYTTKDGKLSITSVSRQLIRELTWLCSMHGIQVGVREVVTPAGRIINKKPLPETRSWNLIIGKTSHPFRDKIDSPNQWKKPIVTKVIAKPYDGYVYDLCGCENEAFFGGEKPVLLHNSRVRDLFKTAKKHAPAIVFIDEIDAVGRHRGAGLGGGHDEREQTLNQILVEMDGFERDTNLIVMAATNRPDILDPALLRPGRFDRRVIIDEPDISDREKILQIHIQEKKSEPDVNLRLIAERTPGFSGADLANLVNEAALLAARRDKKKITQTELLESIEKVLLGPERKSKLLSPKEKEIAAYHEAGHALVASALPNTDPVHKISIISRGKAGGYTLKLPAEEIHFYSKAKFEDELAALLGGYAAEKIVFNEVTTGPTSDLKRASDIARRIVTEYGMSVKLGPISFGEREHLVFLGKELAEQRNYSEEVAAKIDKEVSGFVNRAYRQATQILKTHREFLDKIAKVLLEKETIEQAEFRELIKGLVPAKA